MSKFLRVEALAATLALAIYIYQLAPNPWLVVLVLILPDLSMLGYLAGPKLGARLYNAVHSVIGPALLAAVSLWLDHMLGLQIAAIWGLHITADRALGYGLKFPDHFQHTHLGRIGK